MNPRAAHQRSAADCLADGLRRHGIEARRTTPESQGRGSDAVACWGWRVGQSLKAQGVENVLVMERAYLGDRFVWTSLGWDGLNGRATFPLVDDSSRFWKHFPKLLRPWRERADGYALLLGQVPTDAAVNEHYIGWLNRACRALQANGYTVAFRPHPRHPQLRCGSDRVLSVDEPLEKHLKAARLAVTFNSNSGVESVLAGVPTISVDVGSMAWDVTGHDMTEVVQPCRIQWAERLAWKQWLPNEIEDGTAWEHVGKCLA